MLKVLIYSPLSFCFKGGFETLLMEVIHRLQPMGISFSIVTTDYMANEPEKRPSDVRAFFAEHGCDAVELKSRPFFAGSPPSPIIGIGGYRELRRIAAQNDLIYFNNAYAFQDLMITLTHKITRRPVISSYHAVLFHGDKMHDTYISVISRKLARGFEAHHVLNKEDYRRLKEWGVGKIFLIPGGVDTKKFKPLNRIRKNERMRILFVGRLTKQKGVDVLCDLIKKADQQAGLRRNVEFMIVGSGPLSRLVEEVSKAYENVIYRGKIDSESLRQAYATSDLFVMPSRYETFGVVALEAQSSGLPVIATDISGPNEIIIPPKTGMLIPRLDTQMFLESIRVFLEMWQKEHDAFIQVKKNCRANAVTRFDWDIIAKRFAAMLEEAVSFNTT
jgi:glycosyltransferase involved in cell wall biosynthesis